MNSRDIVRKAWQITQVHLKKLIWYGAVPAFFSVIVSSVYFTYQYNVLRHSELFSDGTTSSNVLPFLEWLWTLVRTYPWTTVVAVIFSIFFLLGYIIIPPIFKGALIEAVMRIRDYKPIHGSLEKGLRRFFPLFEFGIITGSFGIITLFTESSFILRWWGVNVFLVALPVLLFIAMVGLIVTFLFTYSEYFIVLSEKQLIASMKESVILVLSNLRKTILMFVLMLLIGVRVILNVILVLLIPLGLVALSSYFATIFSSFFGMLLIALFGFAILLVASYLLGLFHIFSTAVWVLTFAILTSKEEPKIQDVDLENGKPAPAPVSPIQPPLQAIIV